MKDYPHLVTVKIEKDQFRKVLTWLHDANHKIRETMHFGANHHWSGNDFVMQDVWFKEANAAMMFKLVWGGI